MIVSRIVASVCVLVGTDYALAQVGIPTAPTIALQPLSQLIQYGQSGTLMVGAGGSAPLQYLWRFDQKPIVGAVSGASLELANVQWSTAGSYDVVVTNDNNQSVTSALIDLTICFPDQAASLVDEGATPADETRVGEIED